MATYLMNVPTNAQVKNMSCWHASAQMIWWYWQRKTGRQGPMWTLPQEWKENKGLAVSVEDFIRLAKAVGMKAVPRQPHYNSGDLIWLLKRFGPLWCAGLWYGFGHVVVLTGVENDTVHINDPDQGSKKTGTVSWFNQKMMNHLDGCFMYKDPEAY
jgi:hypothetical protein